MKNILKKISWQSFEQSVSNSINRFPLVCIAIGILFGTSSVLLHLADAPEFDPTVTIQLLISSIFFGLVSLAMHLFLESWKVTDRKAKVGIHALPVVLGIAYFVALPNNLDNPSFETIFLFVALPVLALLGSVAARFSSEIYQSRYTDDSFFIFSLTNVVGIFQSVFIAFALFALLGATFGSLDLLFGISLSAEWYGQFALIAATLIAPFYFINSIPQSLSKDNHELGWISTFLRFLVLYIALPFIVLYLVILYAYSIQVLINFTQWPEGTVSWLVIFFSFFGWFIYVISHPLQSEKFVAIFRKYFPIVLIPQLAMLFYAIILRIMQYGFTINRYLVVVFGIWLVFMSLYMIFSKRKSLVFIPGSLFCVIVLVSVGPWSMFSVSEKAQLGRLEEKLTTYNILEGGELQKLSETAVQEIPQGERTAISSIVKYLCDYHGCRSMQALFGGSYRLAVPTETSPYNEYANIVEYIGIDAYSERGQRDNYYSVYSDQTPQSVSLDGFERLYFATTYTGTNRPESNIYEQDGRVWLYTTRRIDITSELAEFVREYSFSGRTTERDSIVPALQISRDGINALIYIENISARISDEDVFSDLYFTGFVLD